MTTPAITNPAGCATGCPAGGNVRGWLAATTLGVATGAATTAVAVGAGVGGSFSFFSGSGCGCGAGALVGGGGTGVLVGTVCREDACSGAAQVALTEAIPSTNNPTINTRMARLAFISESPFFVANGSSIKCSEELVQTNC
jgi:hypothetical protein